MAFPDALPVLVPVELGVGGCTKLGVEEKVGVTLADRVPGAMLRDTVVEVEREADTFGLGEGEVETVDVFDMLADFVPDEDTEFDAEARGVRVLFAPDAEALLLADTEPVGDFDKGAERVIVALLHPEGDMEGEEEGVAVGEPDRVLPPVTVAFAVPLRRADVEADPLTETVGRDVRVEEVQALVLGVTEEEPEGLRVMVEFGVLEVERVGDLVSVGTAEREGEPLDDWVRAEVEEAEGEERPELVAQAVWVPVAQLVAVPPPPPAPPLRVALGVDVPLAHRVGAEEGEPVGDIVLFAERVTVADDDWLPLEEAEAEEVGEGAFPVAVASSGVPLGEAEPQAEPVATITVAEGDQTMVTVATAVVGIPVPDTVIVALMHMEEVREGVRVSMGDMERDWVSTPVLVSEGRGVEEGPAEPVRNPVAPLLLLPVTDGERVAEGEAEGDREEEVVTVLRGLALSVPPLLGVPVAEGEPDPVPQSLGCAFVDTEGSGEPVPPALAVELPLPPPPDDREPLPVAEGLREAVTLTETEVLGVSCAETVPPRSEGVAVRVGWPTVPEPGALRLPVGVPLLVPPPPPPPRPTLGEGVLLLPLPGDAEGRALADTEREAEEVRVAEEGTVRPWPPGSAAANDSGPSVPAAQPMGVEVASCGPSTQVLPVESI